MPQPPEPDDDPTTLDHPAFSIPGYSPVCAYCAWWSRAYTKRRTCRAYPRSHGIPITIWLGDYYHVAPFPGDHGIRFVVSKDVNLDGPAIPAWIKSAPREGSDEAKAILAKGHGSSE
jgi:hypothetical protein